MRGRLGGRRCAVGLAAVGLVVLAAGCGIRPPVPTMDSVERPEWRVGDRWVFRRTSLAGGTTVVTHQVTEASADGYTVRLSGLTPVVTREWTMELHLRGLRVGEAFVGRFEPALMYFAWPLRLGKEWSQEFEYRDGRRDGRYVNTWRAGSVVDAVDTLVGRVYALRVEHRGSRGERLDTYWYSPVVRYWVRIEDSVGGYTEELVEYKAPL